MEMKVAAVKINERSWSRNTHKEMRKAPRVYVWPVGESLIDNLINRRSRPIKLFRGLALQGLKESGIEVQKMRWSQYAGCTCPCSPGFILDEYTVKGQVGVKFDAHINVESKE
jgi:hypothetical protein